MMGGGAVIAAAAAARRRRRREVLDGFRIGGATAPERARRVDELGLSESRELAELVESGVLIRGPRRDSWYLDEAAYVSHRDARSSRPTRMIVALAVLLVLAGAALVALASQQR
jgi:hypothetical protein